ncbi:NAD(P)-binding domain-containing protein, partial [Providencia stuartii]|uniref:NAD(P)-binding domain-containing protein n=1 Tax=Providencia stuartii TaxID=588 RepID=UPI0013D6D48D
LSSREIGSSPAEAHEAYQATEALRWQLRDWRPAHGRFDRASISVVRGEVESMDIARTGKEVGEVVLAPGGVLDHAKPGTMILDMSTIDPETTDKLHAETRARGMTAVDAPVGRLAWHADRGQSLFMVGADDAD